MAVGNTCLAKVAVQCSANTFVVKITTCAMPRNIIAHLKKQKIRNMNFSLKKKFQKTLNKETTEKLLNISFQSIGFVTILWTLSLIIFHFYAISVLGFNPTYNNPANSVFQENNLIIEMGSVVIRFWIVAMWCSLYIFPILFLINILFKYTLNIKLNWRIILISFTCCLSMWLVLYVPNFGDTFKWILD